jgi:hypothetical protein
MRVTRLELASGTILLVEGRLVSAYTDELARECRSLPPGLILDLKNLRGVDARGATLLAKLLSQGAQLRGVSPYVRLRIEQQHSRLESPGVRIA